MNIKRRGLLAAATLPFARRGRAAGMELGLFYSNAYVLKDTMEALLQLFAKAHPEVTLQSTIAGTYTDQVQFLLRAAITGGLPDISFEGNNFVPLLARRKLAVPLDALIATEPDWADAGYPPSVLTMGQVDGRTMALPFAISIPTVYYNADLVRAAGGDADHFPADWAGIVALGRRIKAASGGLYFDYTPTGNWTFIALVQAAGGRMATPDERRVAFDGPEGLAALQLLRDIGQSGMVDMTRDQAKQAFTAGSIGIFVTASSDITFYETAAGGRFDLRVAPFPVPHPQGTLPAGGNAFMIHAQDPARQKLAWQFIRLATGPLGQSIMARRTSYMPVNEIALQRAELLGDWYRTHPNLAVPVRQLGRVGGWYAFPGENTLKIITTIQDQLHAVITQQRSPEVALADMARDVNRLLAS